MANYSPFCICFINPCSANVNFPHVFLYTFQHTLLLTHRVEALPMPRWWFPKYRTTRWSNLAGKADVVCRLSGNAPLVVPWPCCIISIVNNPKIYAQKHAWHVACWHGFGGQQKICFFVANPQYVQMAEIENRHSLCQCVKHLENRPVCDLEAVCTSFEWIATSGDNAWLCAFDHL